MTSNEKFKLKSRIFLRYDFIPDRMRMHFIETWESLPKISFEDYFELILADHESNKWWVSAQCIKNSYYFYTHGYLDTKQPARLPFYPNQILAKITDEVNAMINFETFK